MDHTIVFGPVPSRRLGRSLGINNIGSKICTYSCIYCQLGKTTRMIVDRESFYSPAEIAGQVKNKLEWLEQQGEDVDYLTFVPSGEPTLDVALGKEIGVLKAFQKRIAVITNASLLWREDVKRELAGADTVSLKIDTVNPDTWSEINRPHKSLSLDSIIQGILSFRRSFKGNLLTETMLLKGINDSQREVGKTADFVSMLEPEIAYLAVPTRPPAEDCAFPTSEQALNQAFQIFSRKLDRVEYLIGYEGDLFSPAGDIRRDLLSIMAVHPMREEALQKLLDKAGASWQVVQELVEAGSLVKTEYMGHQYYVRKPSSFNSKHAY